MSIEQANLWLQRVSVAIHSNGDVWKSGKKLHPKLAKWYRSKYALISANGMNQPIPTNQPKSARFGE